MQSPPQGPLEQGSPQQGPSPRPKKSSKKRALVLVGGGAAVLALVLVTAFLPFGSDHDAQTYEAFEVDGLTFEVTEVLTPGDPEVDALDGAFEFHSSAPGREYLIVSVEVENTSDEYRFWRGGVNVHDSEGRSQDRHRAASNSLEDDQIPVAIDDGDGGTLNTSELQLDPGESGVVRTAHETNNAEGSAYLHFMVQPAPGSSGLDSGTVDLRNR